jgi:hypothetical protein
MAEFNLIQAPEIIGRLARALGVRQVHITPTLSETVQPVVMIADVSRTAGSGPGYGTFRGAASATLGANTFCRFALENPAGSGVLVNVRAWQTSGSAAVTWGVGPTSTLLGGARSKQSDDLFQGGTLPVKFSTAQVAFEITAASTSTAFWGLYTSGAAITNNPYNMLIPPGLALSVGLATAGVAAQVFVISFEWTEEPPPETIGV